MLLPDDTGADSTAASVELDDEGTAASTTTGEEGENTESSSSKTDGKKSKVFGKPSGYHATRRKIERVETKVEELTSLLKNLASQKNESSDETEKQARDYLRNLSKEILQDPEVLENLVKEIGQRQGQTEKALLSNFEDELEEVVEETGFSEDDLLDICEEEDVSPKVAAKILKRQGGAKKPVVKPKLPTSSRGEPSGSPLPKIETKGLNFYEVARQIKAKLANK